MTKIKKVLLTVVAAACAVTLLNVSAVKAEAAEKSASQKYVEAMQPGWNLGNTFDSVDTWSDRTASWYSDQGETTWGNPKVTKELIHKIKESGFKSIRMPFTSDSRTGDAPDYKIRQDYLDRYAEVVNYALDEGLYVIADMQHVDISIWGHNMYTDDGTSLNRFKAVWKQFAEYFKDYPEQLIFEPTNEPDFVGTKEEKVVINNKVNNTFREIIRSSGGKNATRMILFPNLATNAEEIECVSNSQNILNANDPNIIATFHYYSYWPFSVNIAGKPKFDAEVQNHAKSAIDIMDKYFISKGIGVIGGEYSVLSEGVINNGEYLKYMDYTTSYAAEKGIPMMLWDAGFHIDRTKLVWKDQDVIDVIMNAVNGGRASYTDCDTLYVSGKTFAYEDATMGITLNGNKLVAINDGNKNLIEGTDYTLNNGVLTFKNSYLKSIMNKSYGKCTTLSLKFDNGPDWKMDVNYYAMAVTENATGTIDKFDVPMMFNGSKIATMEAVYADGSGAGSANWTSYKQMREDYEADYANNKVILKNALLKDCKDGTITLKFHFEDGLITTYTLNKSGNNITGTAVNIEDPTVVKVLNYGDVNDDGVITLVDYTLLRKYITLGNTGINLNTSKADVNRDGDIDFLDLIALKQKL